MLYFGFLSGFDLLIIAWLWLWVVSGLFARHNKYKFNLATVLWFPLMLGVIAYFPFLLLALASLAGWL
jgi:hypothetical protein